jgi:hypothetical protein
LFRKTHATQNLNVLPICVSEERSRSLTGTLQGLCGRRKPAMALSLSTSMPVWVRFARSSWSAAGVLGTGMADVVN